MDMDLGGDAFSEAILLPAVHNNKTSEFYVDQACYRVLVSKFAAGLFEHPFTDESRVETLDAPENRVLAREAAEQSMVLLINKNDTLPLNIGSIKELAMVGPLADSAFDHCGSYFNAGANVITTKAAVEAGCATNGVTMTYSLGASAEDEHNLTMIPAAVAQAMSADVVVAVLGDSRNTCGEMVDRSDLDLPGGQLPLLKALVATGKPVVVLLINGRQMTFGRGNAVLDGLAALMVGWRPGEEGGPAFWNVLTGVVNPSGRLAHNWPRSVGGIGGPSQYLYPFQGNHMGEAYSAGDGESTPLFQFGQGLSYTTFDLNSLSVSPNATTAKGTFKLTLTASNTGERDGAVVVQVYFRDPVSWPVRIASIQLVRFTKVLLRAGESREITIDLDAADLAYWDDGLNGNDDVPPGGGWRVDPGEFNLVVGTAGFTSWRKPDGLLGNVYVLPSHSASHPVASFV